MIIDIACGRRICTAAILMASLAVSGFGESPAVQPPAAEAPAATPPPPAAAPFPLTVDRSVLPDGAHVVIMPDPAATETVVDIFFRVGQSDEGKWPGINALITRSWISAADNRSAMELQGDIARAGGAVGAASGPEWTELWGVCAPDSESFGKLTQTLLTHVVSEPKFERTAVELARADQRRALELRQDKLLLNVMDDMQNRAFGDQPYGLPLLGTADALESLPWADVGVYYRRVFRPDRVVIVVAGNVKIDEAKKRILACIGGGGWDEAKPAHGPIENLAAVPPIPVTLRDHIVHRSAPAVCVADGYLAPGTDSKTSTADYATLLVLDAVLGGGKASRLFAMRDIVAGDATPIGYEVRSVLLTGRMQSLWSVYAIGDRPSEQIQSQLQATLGALADNSKPITDAELAHAKIYLKARHLKARERIKDRAYGAGWSEVMGLGAAFDTTYDAMIDGVSLADATAMAHKVFSSHAAAAHSLLHTPLTQQVVEVPLPASP